MENLKVLSTVELYERIATATAELIDREIKSIPIKTEKRNAKVGERILIVNASSQQLGESYNSGDIMKVTELKAFTRGDVGCGEFGYIDAFEYEVIIEDGVSAPVSSYKTSNSQRAELNQQAREFVENLIDGDGKVLSGSGNLLPVEFIVNADKNTVVCLIRSFPSGANVTYRGIAKCMPGDVFNGWIGKAIALARTLEISIPKEFLDAVQPDKVVVGMVVGQSEESLLEFDNYIVGSIGVIDGVTRIYEADTYNSWARVKNISIIDDTNAEYENKL